MTYICPIILYDIHMLLKNICMLFKNIHMLLKKICYNMLLNRICRLKNMTDKKHIYV